MVQATRFQEYVGTLSEDDFALYLESLPSPHLTEHDVLSLGEAVVMIFEPPLAQKQEHSIVAICD